jgi:hypothetical protein
LIEEQSIEYCGWACCDVVRGDLSSKLKQLSRRCVALPAMWCVHRDAQLGQSLHGAVLVDNANRYEVCKTELYTS